MSVLQALTVTVTIARPPQEVYDYAREERNFAAWTTSFSRSIRQEDDWWIVETDEDPVYIRFVPRNDYGILDHEARVGDGSIVWNRMRVVPNGSGSEVLFTLFRQPDVSEAKFAEDAGMVRRDLETLRRVLEG
ncbi:polyketide cyclase [Paenibacillus flagellatus]|uniref:Polyketide cyclase n=2 Tax=Paenibacillus flagellatus TaxID=2211139 RepID=A0A2V5K011_9BACL|nr:polyketide cyclase [Paenibacillus flagellatus]